MAGIGNKFGGTVRGLEAWELSGVSRVRFGELRLNLLFC